MSDLELANAFEEMEIQASRIRLVPTVLNPCDGYLENIRQMKTALGVWSREHQVPFKFTNSYHPADWILSIEVRPRSCAYELALFYACDSSLHQYGASIRRLDGKKTNLSAQDVDIYNIASVSEIIRKIWSSRE